MRRKFLAIIMVLALVACLLPMSSFATAVADENGTVVVHFYNGDNEYTNDNWNGKAVQWGAYYWIDTGRVAASIADDPDFSRTVNDVTNVGRLFRVGLNASETKAVKQGKKLGFIMVRSYIDELGYLTPYWFGNAGKDLNSDRYLNVVFDGNNEYHIWIIAGDKNNYESLEQAKSAFERVQSAKFDDFDTLIVQTTKPITTATNIDIYKTDDLKNDSEGAIYKEAVHASSVSEDGLVGTVTGLNMKSDFDWNSDYQIYIEDVSPFRTSAIKTRLFLSDEFKSQCIPDDNVELGANYGTDKTVFRLWAPASTNVSINFYKSGNELDSTLYRSEQEMSLTSKGVWQATVDGDLNGIYYTYTNYVEGEAKEVVDVYAKALGVNGNRGMICDLDSTDPKGWEEDINTAKNIREYNSKAAVIWEIHVRDFSISADSGITYKGKYMAFTEDNTYVKGSDTIKSGISYLKELGITYVQLNPVYDFSTVDEEYINNTDYTTKQNWGYDPKNYNVPEGSYATDAEDGKVRINEFKQMVQALHNAGIGVIMDVVYNHTYTADSWFEKTVPGYYYRQALKEDVGSFGYKNWQTTGLGQYAFSDGSGCSNETASERAMYRKYMIDSLYYWAEEYHIDGFRFDLMAIHDVTTMNAIRAKLDTLPGGTGILMYGEPWAAGALGIDPKDSVASANSDNLNLLDARIAAFNDRMREGIKGNNDGGTGYVQGNVDGTINRVKAGINGLFLNYSGDGTISDWSGHSITYTTSHDNYTLWDQLIYTTVGTKSPSVYSEYNGVIEKKNMLAATLTLTSKGISFILAGEEIARTKFGNHNSYNAQDKINAIDYYRQEEFDRLFNWYKGLLRLRTQEFRTISASNNHINPGDHEGCLIYNFNREIQTDTYSQVMVMLNPFSYSKEIPLIGSWIVLADGKAFDFDSTKSVSGSITLPAYSSYILVNK